MNQTLRFGLLSVAMCLPLTTALAQDKKTQLIKGWGEVIDPDGDCQVTEEKGDLTITVPKSWHDLTYTDEYSKLNSPRVLQPIEEDFSLQVTVRAFSLPKDTASSGGRHSFVSSGLLVWQDEQNFIRLERATVANSPTPFVWFERFKGGKPVSDELKPLADKQTGLRVERKGNHFTFLFDDGGEGRRWDQVHSEEIALPAKLQAGVLAINTTVRALTAQLTNLQVGPKK